MTFTLFILALAAFLAAAAFGIFAVLVVSIRRGQRTQFLSNPPEGRAGIIARRALIGMRNDSEKDR